MIKALERQDILNCINSEELSFISKLQLLYKYQSETNSLYHNYIKAIGKELYVPNNAEDCIFLPISFFKTHEIRSGDWSSQCTFRSSGTSNSSIRSSHMVRSIADYHRNTIRLWKSYFGSIAQYEILSLLPNYHENPESSLLSMLSYFTQHSLSSQNHSYLYNFGDLNKHLEKNIKLGVPTLVFGVRFALYDYALQYKHGKCDKLMVVETGGMKKRERELSNREISEVLNSCFAGGQIVGEYGMTECFSQLYDPDQKGFKVNDRMRVVISDVTDPFEVVSNGTRGRINIIDLANVDTISFISTDDLGYIDENQRLHILGRIDHCDIRGCNHLIS